ncbi:MAG TPA: fatty acid desaturase [Tepidisphaeraceae bacterium]|nr:fatty acid desaturase [Tepidisphaeraceae bacterium]
MRDERELPSLESLGCDLLSTTPRRRRAALARPFLGVLAFAVLAHFRWWWVEPIVVFLIFVAVVTVTHDVAHGSLGLGRWQTEWALFIFGALLLESGHAYRLTHRQHHRVFPGPDDPEGDPARMSLVRAIFWGPMFLPRLWIWAFGRARSISARCWLLAEAMVALAVPIIGILCVRQFPAMLIYCILAIIGSWVYPLLTVHLPHHDYGPTSLTQTSTLRGRIIPALFLELTYHLEHHLYPQVPAHHLPELSRRLEPVFRRVGVQPRRVI